MYAHPLRVASARLPSRRLPELKRQWARIFILLIDDDPEVCSSLGMSFQAQGHKVYQDMVGLEGVKVNRPDAFDSVITDVKMLRMDGFEAFTNVKRPSPEAEVIVNTAFNLVENAFRAMWDGAFGFFEAVQCGRTERFFAPDQGLRGISSGEEHGATLHGGGRPTLWSGGDCVSGSSNLRHGRMQKSPRDQCKRRIGSSCKVRVWIFTQR